jgi:hypothetical protein
MQHSNSRVFAVVGAPALSVLILGLLALRVIPGRSKDVAILREARHQ